MDRTQLTPMQREEIAKRLAAERLETVNSICEKVSPRDSFYAKYIKRIFDVSISLVVLTVTLPVNVVIGIVTFFDVGRPIFFKQERIGKDGKIFKLVKFRNMTNETDSQGNLLPAAQRVTKFGKFVRKTSLDELLNFWSILKGDMSIIGPRPLVIPYGARFSQRHAQRSAVRPGLECPPRNNNVALRNWHDQFENDIWYVENISFLTDCKMICHLVRFALDKKNSAYRAAVRKTFMGYDWNGHAISIDDVPQEYIDVYENKNSVEESAV